MLDLLGGFSPTSMNAAEGLNTIAWLEHTYQR
jgi:hypothetical protein